MSVQGEITTPAGRISLLESPHATQDDTRLLLPREHGSWALWLLPLLSGSIVGYGSVSGAAALPAVWFSAVATSVFLIHQPLESLLGLSVLKIRSARERRIAILWVISLTVIAALGVLKLVQLHRGLILVFGFVALGCFSLAALFGHTRSLRVPKQLVGAAGLTSTAAGAYYVITGQVDQAAFILWLASWLFAAGQIEYVQLRMRTARMKTRGEKARAAWKVLFLHLLALAAALVSFLLAGMPLLLTAAFVPATLRLLVWMTGPTRPLRLYVIGFSELLQSVIFSVLLTIAFLMHV